MSWMTTGGALLRCLTSLHWTPPVIPWAHFALASSLVQARLRLHGSCANNLAPWRAVEASIAPPVTNRSLMRGRPLEPRSFPDLRSRTASLEFTPLRSVTDMIGTGYKVIVYKTCGCQQGRVRTGSCDSWDVENVTAQLGRTRETKLHTKIRCSAACTICDKRWCTACATQTLWRSAKTCRSGRGGGTTTGTWAILLGILARTILLAIVEKHMNSQWLTLIISIRR